MVEFFRAALPWFFGALATIAWAVIIIEIRRCWRLYCQLRDENRDY